MVENTEHIKCSDNGLGVVKVTLDRPSELNALDMGFLGEICRTFESLEHLPDVRVVLLESAVERAFIAGADIGQMSEMGPLDFRRYTGFLRRLERVMTGSEKVFIAAVKGFAFGGGNIMAMNCDLVFATPEARFGQQEIDLGILGGLPRLTHLVGARRAWDIVLTGRIITGREAEEIGLITKCVPAGEFDSYLDEYVNSIISRSETAISLSKALKRVSENVGLEAAFQHENELISLCFDSGDTKRRLKAFAERGK